MFFGIAICCLFADLELNCLHVLHIPKGGKASTDKRSPRCGFACDTVILVVHSGECYAYHYHHGHAYAVLVVKAVFLNSSSSDWPVSLINQRTLILRAKSKQSFGQKFLSPAEEQRFCSRRRCVWMFTSLAGEGRFHGLYQLE